MRNLTATICLTLAVLIGSAGVSWGADFQKAFAAAKSGDYATALPEFESLAKKGSVYAQYNLGVMYGAGMGVPQDDKPMLTLDKARHPLSVMQKRLEHVGRFLNSGLRRTPPKNRGTLSFVGTILIALDISK